MSADVETLRAHLQRRQEAQRARAMAHAERLLAKMEHAAAILRGYGAREVILFGSLATGRVRESSDVDLAVRGLPERAYFTAAGELMAHFVAPVDLVRLEDAPPPLRDRIAKEGRSL